MALHFTTEEFAGRQARARGKLAERGLDGLLMFRQESMYYLTGYDSFGFVYFQCLYLGADGALTLLTRAPDLRQAQHTSTIADIRIWVDRAGAEPAGDLRAILDEHGCKGARLGVELEAYGLTGRSWRMVERALDGFCTLDDASELVSELRLIKSPAELVYLRRAAELADDALDAANRLAVAGAFEGDILAAMLSPRAATRSGPAGRSARCSTPTPACSTTPATARTARTPAAIRWARRLRPIGWTGRCSTPAIR